MRNILVIGATGNVGRPIWDGILRLGITATAAVRTLYSGRRDLGENAKLREFDFLNAKTFSNAFLEIETLFLIRPPQLSHVKRDLAPALFAAKSAGVKHIVFLSLLGAEANSFVPHRKVEILIDQLGFTRTFLRPSFFMQNLSTTHLVEIRDRDEIFVPAGKGKTSFIDVRDIAEVGIKALTEPGHEGKAYELTGSEALSYAEVAKILSAELGRTIRYKNPSALRFLIRKRCEGLPWAFALVMTVLYTVCRLGLAGTVTNVLPKLLGRQPISLKQFAKDNRLCFILNTI